MGTSTETNPGYYMTLEVTLYFPETVPNNIKFNTF